MSNATIVCSANQHQSAGQNTSSTVQKSSNAVVPVQQNQLIQNFNKHQNCSALIELQQRDQWVCWKREYREDKNGNKSSTKPPYDPKTGYNASTTNSAHWGTFEKAWETFLSGGYDGIGFVFTEDDPYIGVDLDHAYDATSGVINGWAADIITSLDSYTEISPGGDGFHILTRGDITRGGNKHELPGTDGNNAVFEMYKTGRYFTVTLNSYHPQPLPINTRTSLLEALCQKYLVKPPATPNPAIHAIQQNPVQVSNADDQTHIIAGINLKSRGISDNVINTINKPILTEDRSKPEWGVLSSLVEWGFSDEEINNVILASPIGDKAREQGMSWFAEEIKRARQKTAPVLPTDPWPKPLPLKRVVFPEQKYPVEALPQKIKDAVLECHRYGQQPISMIAGVALSAVSLACQSQVNVEIDSALKGPISLYTLIIANSGEGKTSVSNIFKPGMRQWEDEKTLAMQKAKAKCGAKKNALHAKLNSLKKQYEEKVIAGEVDADDMLDQIAATEEQIQNCPNVLLPKMFHEDTTMQGLLESLSLHFASSSAWSDEGGVLVGGNAMSKENATNTLANLNLLWNGNDVDVTRRTMSPVQLKGHRFTLCLMVQSVVMQDLLTGPAKRASGIGLFARTLMAQPTSNIGKRRYAEPQTEGYVKVNIFMERLVQILDLTPAMNLQGELTPPVLPLSEDAKKYWIEYFNNNSAKQADGECYAKYTDIASKSAEQAARIAACLHVLEFGPSGEISATTAQSGIELAHWYLNEAIRIMQMTEHSLVIENAEKIMKWLNTQQQDIVRATNILKDSGIRDLDQRNDALLLLESAGWVRLFCNGVGNKKTNYIAKNPFLNSMNRMNRNIFDKDDMLQQPVQDEVQIPVEVQETSTAPQPNLVEVEISTKKEKTAFNPNVLDLLKTPEELMEEEELQPDGDDGDTEEEMFEYELK